MLDPAPRRAAATASRCIMVFYFVFRRRAAHVMITKYNNKRSHISWFSTSRNRRRFVGSLCHFWPTSGNPIINLFVKIAFVSCRCRQSRRCSLRELRPPSTPIAHRSIESAYTKTHFLLLLWDVVTGSGQLSLSSVFVARRGLRAAIAAIFLKWGRPHCWLKIVGWGFGPNLL